MEAKVENLIKAWQRRGIAGFFCADGALAAQKILELIPQEAGVGFSGSMTLEQIGIIKRLEARKNEVFNQNKPGISREESLDLRRKGAGADYFLASANAVSEKGELVFFSAYGNRSAGITYAKNVIVVCGVNKIVPNLEQAFSRSREFATPLNCQRLNWNTPCLKDGICRKEICLAPEYKRMCCQILIIEAEALPERMKVILVGENLGF